ncbi:MAG: hypothetical protein GKR92_08130 [Gammaproteobacteria bacterium]|nr:MAG: hypothetical protein GKR92_08130 [Gammaproteobacteria bacterium]
MDFTQILELLSTIPIWAWAFGGFIIFMFVFGDQKLWELEVKFPTKPGVGRGEVEFECHKKKGSSIELKFTLEDLYQNKDIEIILNNKSIYTIPVSKNTSARTYINEKFALQKPNEGDKVEVNIGGKKQFEGVLVRD